MEESAAFLVPSYSQLSPGEGKKGNPIQRALTASVSFGRFMSESLDWEKWSAFTNNRYLEEVEKYSKPGSVAEKKAYFEAHFKRRRAAALLEQQSAAAYTVSETAKTVEKIGGSYSLDLGCIQRECDEITEIAKEEEIQSSDPVVPIGQSSNYAASVARTLEVTEPEGTEKLMEPIVVMGNSLDLMGDLEDDVCNDDVESEKKDKVCRKEDSARRHSALGEKMPEAVVPIQLKNGDKAPESKHNALDSSNKRRSYTTSLHMSINFSSCPDATQNDRSMGLPKIESLTFTRAPAKKYKNSVLPRTSTRASVNIFKDGAAPSAENKRTVRTRGNSISEPKTADEKGHFPSSNYSKSSNVFENKARISTVPSSFTFKSEERAVKRREFYQMLEQKAKVKDTGKNQMHAKPQVRRRSNDMKFRNSLALETAKGAEAAPLRNITKKIPTGRTCFPKIEERAAAAAAIKVQDSNIIRPPWRLPAKSETLKDFAAKNSRQPGHSAKCLPKKHMNENASPNIQL